MCDNCVVFVFVFAPAVVFVFLIVFVIVFLLVTLLALTCVPIADLPHVRRGRA